MICPACQHDHDCAWPPHGYCVNCGEDMSDQVREAEKEWAAEKKRENKEIT